MQAAEQESILTALSVWERIRAFFRQFLPQSAQETEDMVPPEPAEEVPASEESEDTLPIDTLPDGSINGSEPTDSEDTVMPEEIPEGEVSGSEHTEEAVTEDGTVIEPEPKPEPLISTGMWISMGVALAFAVLAAVMTTLWLRARRKKSKPMENTPSPERKFRVTKLHEQGARDHQQDCFFISPEQYYQTYGILAVVADGMGGMADGDRFSQTVVRAMMNPFLVTPGTPDEVLKALLLEANRAVNRLMTEEGVGRGGSTLVAALLKDGFFHYLSVGDSRIALFRNGVLYQLNREHILRHELSIAAINGEMSLQEAAAHPKAAGLVSYLGMGQLKYIDFPAQPVRILPGDRFLLMSDGVYNALTEEELCDTLNTSEDPAAELKALISGKGYRNQDNYTAVIIDC